MELVSMASIEQQSNFQVFVYQALGNSHLENSLQTLVKTQTKLFTILSGQSFINKNCLNSRTSHDVDIKLGKVTKIEKGNTTRSKKFEDVVISRN